MSLTGDPDQPSLGKITQDCGSPQLPPGEPPLSFYATTQVDPDFYKPYIEFPWLELLIQRISIDAA